MTDPPATTQTSTFVFSDIEGSTKLLQRLGDRYAATLDEHRRLIAAAVESNGGRVFGSEGDALFCAFPTAGGAIAAAAAAQRSLTGHEWPEDGAVRVRMGVHSGEALATGGDFVGLALHQVARIMAAGHGGQVLVSEATRLLLPALPAGLELRDLGERRLKDLASAERLYQLVGAGLPDRFPALRTLDSKPNNLPVQLTSFVGRAELAAARDALVGTRLLTLTGPGGTGKTRLALQLAGEASDGFADGVFFVALDSVRDAGLVPSVIASTIGLNVSGSVPPLDAVIEFLREKHVLLVLDNFEQVVDAATDVARLLREAPDIKIVVTTRIVLRLYGEQEFPVGPLGLPSESEHHFTAQDATHYEAVRLFVERAMAVQPAFMLTDQSAPLVVEIARRLDGLPLAIELAAARTRVLPVAAIHARLDQHLNMLTGGARDLPGRQQTLRGAIDWSYDLLEPSDRRLFARFSIHAGGAFLTQADAVCGPASELGEDVLDGLSSLSDKSLVKANLTTGEDPRFAMLATIRDYARERLAASDENSLIELRHADAYLAEIESISSELLGMDGRRLTDRLELDLDNLRSALDSAVRQGRIEYALRFIIAIWRFWQVRGHLDEARRQVDVILTLPGVADQPAELLAKGYNAAGGICYWQGDALGTYEYYAKALAAAKRSGDRRLIAEAMYNQGFAPRPQEHADDDLYAAGRPLFEESLALYRELGDDRGVADASWALSISLAAGGDDRAHTLEVAEEALKSYRRLNDPFRTGWGGFIVGSLRIRDDAPEVVKPYFDEALRIFAEARDQTGIQMLLAAVSFYANRLGQRERAYRLAGAVEKLRLATGAGLTDAPVRFLEFTPLGRPDDPDLLRAWEEGARMSTEEAIAYALSKDDWPISAS
jgi:predicted ATPase/class 3 adenylate cyclase